MNQNKTLKITASSFETLRLSLFRAACAMLTLAGSAACAAETISVRVTDDGSYAILADGVEMTGDFARELPSAANEGRPQGSYWAPQALVHGKTRHADGTARVKTVPRNFGGGRRIRFQLRGRVRVSEAARARAPDRARRRCKHGDGFGPRNVRGGVYLRNSARHLRGVGEGSGEGRVVPPAR